MRDVSVIHPVAPALGESFEIAGADGAWFATGYFRIAAPHECHVQIRDGREFKYLAECTRNQAEFVAGSGRERTIHPVGSIRRAACMSSNGDAEAAAWLAVRSGRRLMRSARAMMTSREDGSPLANRQYQKARRDIRAALDSLQAFRSCRAEADAALE